MQNYWPQSQHERPPTNPRERQRQRRSPIAEAPRWSSRLPCFAGRADATHNFSAVFGNLLLITPWCLFMQWQWRSERALIIRNSYQRQTTHKQEKPSRNARRFLRELFAREFSVDVRKNTFRTYDINVRASSVADLTPTSTLTHTSAFHSARFSNT